MNILNVQSSARHEDSVTRQLSAMLVERLSAGGATVVEREADNDLPPVSKAWTQGAYIPEADRTSEQREALRLSDELVAELKAADAIVIGAPVYNFTIPASLKLWIDQVCRAGVTFKFGENGPVGLLEGKKAYVVLASGGTAVGSEVDFHTPYLRHVLGFIGLHDVEFVSADQLMMKGEAPLDEAKGRIEALAA